MLTNTYCNPATLFIGGENITLCEGTTQGDPLAMVKLGGEVKQSCHVDDASAGGGLGALHKVVGQLDTMGPKFGYHLNASKTW